MPKKFKKTPPADSAAPSVPAAAVPSTPGVTRTDDIWGVRLTGKLEIPDSPEIYVDVYSPTSKPSRVRVSFRGTMGAQTLSPIQAQAFVDLMRLMLLESRIVAKELASR